MITFALLLAGSACIITIPKRDAAATSTPTPVRPETANRVERIMSSQATQIAALRGEILKLEAQLQAQATMIHYLATRGPALPPPADRLITPTPYYPLRGRIEIEEGRCCVGGIAGGSTTIKVAVSAQSPFAEITAMRVHAGGSPLAPVQFDQVAWRSYTQSISFEIPIAVNWVGFYVQVQFRDGLGNLSPIYVDDISVEGMPAPPPSTP